MSEDFLADRRRALEESFFRHRNMELLERLKREAILEARRNELARASGISDQKLLDRLIDLDMQAATVAALSLVPLVRIAWADGALNDLERDAILQASVDSGLSTDSPGYHWLVAWLQTEPEPELVRCWNDYVAALLNVVSADDREALQRGLLGRARDVALAAGGFLGLGAKISPEEQCILSELDGIFASQRTSRVR